MTARKAKNEADNSPAGMNSTSDKRRDRTQTNDSQKRFWRDWEPTEKFTFVIAIFTVVYSLITLGLYLIARDTMRVDQRAWIAPLRFLLSAEPEEGKEITLTFWYNNTGKTPGINVIPRSRL